MDMGDRIKELRLRHGMTQEELGEQIGVQKAAVNKWETGLTKNLKRSTIYKLSLLFDVPPSYLMGMEESSGNTLQEEGTSYSTSISIPVYGSIPAGVAIEAVEDIEEHIDIPAVWQKCNKEYIALKVKGDSMYPKYLEGDTVVILLQPDCESGQDCAVYINGYDVTLKTVLKEKNNIILKPINPLYPPQTFSEKDEVVIIGIVKELRRKI